MTERERIKQMVDDGKISQDEANLLLEALDDVDEADAAVDTAASGADSVPMGDFDPMKNFDPMATGAPPTPPKVPEPPQAHGKAGPTGLRWVRVDMTAGSLKATVDTSLKELKPALSGKGEIEIVRSGDNWEVSIKGSAQGWLGNILNTDAHVELRIPEGFGLELDARAGQLEARDLPYLKGRMLAGSVEADNLQGIDLDMKAGTLRTSLLLSEGRHSLDMKAGTARVKLLRGSDVRVEGDVKAGSVVLSGPFEQQQRIAGSKFQGSLRSGRAHFQLSQKAGTLDLEVERE